MVSSLTLRMRWNYSFEMADHVQNQRIQNTELADPNSGYSKEIYRGSIVFNFWSMAD